jgi:putative transposase
MNSAMPQSLSRILIHTVFSTKNRERWFQDEAVLGELHAYLGGIAKKLDCLPMQVGAVVDHVHLLTTLPRTGCVADLVKEVKRVSTNWLHERGGVWLGFHWQAGYAAFSVSESNLSAVVQYVANQARDHEKMSFEDEYRELLQRHGEQWDERYVWD